jgi:hypothetical protein
MSHHTQGLRVNKAAVTVAGLTGCAVSNSGMRQERGWGGGIRIVLLCYCGDMDCSSLRFCMTRHTALTLFADIFTAIDFIRDRNVEVFRCNKLLRG